MRRGLKLFATGFIAMSALAMNVNAEEVSNETELNTCIAKTNNICKLTSNVVLSKVVDIKDGVDVVLDLNGHSIKPNETLVVTGGMIQVIHGGKLTVQDSGENGIISAVSSKVYGAIQVTKKDHTNINKPATLVINDGNIEGYYYAITGSGNDDRINTNITINGGKLTSLKSDTGLGIYHPQDGNLIVNGGEIVGATGIEMRAGKLNVTGGTIRGTYKPIEVNSNKNGSTTSGAGIAVAQHTTEKAIDVTISGGTIEGYTALYESNPEENEITSIKKISIKITGGTFNAINEGKTAIYSENVTGFITSGEFNSDVTDYLASVTNLNKTENGYEAETTYEVTKGEEQKVTIKEGTEVTITIDADFDLFKDLYINNKLVDKKYYTVKSGSTIITLSSDFVETLEKGEYEVTAEFTDGGTATTNLTVLSNNTSEKTTAETTTKKVENPKTLDNIIIYVMLSILSLLGLTTISNRIYKSNKI